MGSKTKTGAFPWDLTGQSRESISNGQGVSTSNSLPQSVCLAFVSIWESVLHKSLISRVGLIKVA